MKRVGPYCMFGNIWSEGTGADHRHHNNVPNRRQDSDPQPDSVTGDFPIILCFRRAGTGHVEVGGGSLQGRVAIVRRIH